MQRVSRGGDGVSLASAVEDAIDGKPGILGVYARNPGTGETIDIHGNRVLPAESAAKTFVLVDYS